MRRYLVLAVGVVMAVAGTVLALSSPSGSQDYGWFAYTPLDNPGPDWFMTWPDSPSSSAALVTTGQVAGWVVVALGLVVVAGWTGFRLGRRGQRPYGVRV